MKHRRVQWRAALIVLAGVVGAAVAAAPASAEIIEEDRLVIEAGRADFGFGGAHLLGRPLDPAEVLWGDGEEDAWVTVVGALFYDAPFDAGCALAEVRLQTIHREEVETFSLRHCESSPPFWVQGGFPMVWTSDDVRVAVVEICVDWTSDTTATGGLERPRCRLAERPWKKRPPVVFVPVPPKPGDPYNPLG